MDECFPINLQYCSLKSTFLILEKSILSKENTSLIARGEKDQISTPRVTGKSDVNHGRSDSSSRKKRKADNPAESGRKSMRLSCRANLLTGAHEVVPPAANSKSVPPKGRSSRTRGVAEGDGERMLIRQNRGAPKISTLPKNRRAKSANPAAKPTDARTVFKSGDVVMAKQTSFPFWPAIILPNSETSSQEVLFWQYRNSKWHVTRAVVPSHKVFSYSNKNSALILNPKNRPRLDMECDLADEIKHLTPAQKILHLCLIRYPIYRDLIGANRPPTYSLGEVVLVNKKEVGVVTPEPFLVEHLRSRRWEFGEFVHVTLVSAKGMGLYSESDLLPDPATHAPFLNSPNQTKMRRRVELAKRYAAMSVEDRLKLPKIAV